MQPLILAAFYGPERPIVMRTLLKVKQCFNVDEVTKRRVIHIITLREKFLEKSIKKVQTDSLET